MDHQTLVSSLSPQTRAELTEKSDKAGLKHLALHICAIATTGLWIGLSLPLWWLILLPHGILLTFLFTLEHECTHQTPFKTLWLNEFVGRFCGLVIFLPFLWFRYFHLAHHRYTNDPNRDPERSDPGKPETWNDYVIYVSGFRFWKSVFRTLLTNAIWPSDAHYLPEARKHAMVWEARTMLTIYAIFLLTFPSAVFWLWLLPLIIGQPFLRLYLLAEHGHCPPVANMLENTRTTYTNRLIRLMAWNMPYHAEHHAFPAVPFFRLPDFHTETQPHLKSTSDGYAKFTQSYLSQISD